MRQLSDLELEEAKLDLRKLNDPAYGGFNLLYNDNYFAAGLVRKWRMSLEGLEKMIKKQESIKPLEVHQEPVEFSREPAEHCILCGKSTRTWLDPHTPLCKTCATDKPATVRAQLEEIKKKAAKIKAVIEGKSQGTR